MTLEASNSRLNNDQNAFMQRVKLEGQGEANPDSTITSGKARFTVLTSRLIRLEWSKTGEFEERGTFAFPNRYSKNVASFKSQNIEGVLTIKTDYLTLQYKQNSEQFSPENLQIEFKVGTEWHLWKPGMANPLNLGGTNRTLDTTWGDVRISEGLVSRAGWTVFDDSNSVLLSPEDNWVQPPRSHDVQDWYFFGYGHDYKAALTEYLEFGGKVPLIPRFVLGAWWSRYWAYSDQDLKNLVLDFEQHNLPLDVLVVDMDWHTTHSWTGYTWNHELFPDPEGFLAWVHEHGLRTTLNLHPALGVQSFEKPYETFARSMNIDPANGETIPFQITNPDFVQNYFEILHHPLEEQGVDFWWMDWQQGESSEMEGLDPLMWLNHLHFQDSARRDVRSMLYSRWGGLGNHRYHIGFSGDTYATWAALQFQPYMTATASNVLYGWWSHDIGGHIGPTEPELYARWVQYGALSPCLRLHSTKDPLAERRPWAFAPDIYQATKEAFQLRYELVPYLYTLARIDTDTGISMCRPMYYDYPENEAAYNSRYQYMIGDDMLAAPIVFPADPLNGIAASDVWIPEGTWIDYHTLETFQGPRWVRLVGDINRVPILMKAGSIVTLATVAPTTDELPKDQLTLRIFTYPDTEGVFKLYEDDGNTNHYEQGQYQWTNITNRTGSSEVELFIEGVEGHCDSMPMERNWTVRFEGTLEPQDFTVEGAALETKMHYVPATETTIISFKQQNKNHNIKLVVKYGKNGLSTLGEQKNRQIIASDLRCLLGERYSKTGYEEFRGIVPSLQMNALGRADALARLGEPFVRIIEYVSPNDCVRQLGTVIVANPVIEENSKLAVVIKWTLFRNGKAQHTISEVDPNSSSDGGYIVQCPFSVGPNDPAQMMQWTAEIKVQWENETLIYAHQSKTLFPAIADWRVVIYDQEKNQNFGIDQILSDVKQINPNLEWQNYRQEVETTVSLDGPYTLPVYKKHLEQLNAGEKLACYAVTVINSPDEREVMLEFRAAGPLRFWMNGQPVEQLTITTGGRPVRSMIFNQLQVPRRTAAFQLKAGTNILLVASEPPERHHWWYFSVAVVRPDGSLMNDLSYSNYVEEAENVETELNSNPTWNPPTQSVPSQTDEQIPEEKS